MTHPDSDLIFDIARKQIQGEIFTDSEVKTKMHIGECEDCRNRFISCMGTIGFFNENFSIPVEPEEKSLPLTSVVTETKEKLLYSFALVIDKIKDAYTLSDSFARGILRPFELDMSPAMARGGDDGTVVAVSKESLVTFDPEERILEVCIDIEDVGEGEFIAMVEADGEKHECVMVDDGHGMLTAMFENIDAMRIHVSVIEK